MLSIPKLPLFSVVLGHIKVTLWYFLSYSLLYPIFNWIPNLRSQDATMLAFAQLLKCTSAQLKAFCCFHLCFLPNNICILHFYIAQLYQILLPCSSLLGLQRTIHYFLITIHYYLITTIHYFLTGTSWLIKERTVHPLKVGFTGSVGWGAGHVLEEKPQHVQFHAWQMKEQDIRLLVFLNTSGFWYRMYPRERPCSVIIMVTASSICPLWGHLQGLPVLSLLPKRQERCSVWCPQSGGAVLFWQGAISLLYVGPQAWKWPSPVRGSAFE